MTVAEQQDLTGGLLKALADDGFTVYCFGSKEDPTALLAVYEWPDYLDVITVPRRGPAAAARLAKPADALNPPPRAVWAWVAEEPESVIWALLRLAHPDHLDAPAEKVLTPAALRIPLELQRPVHIRKPPPEKAGARGDRLSSQEREENVSREFFRLLFAQVDSFAAVATALNFTNDATFHFGNYPPMVGPTAIAGFVETLCGLVSMVRHRIYDFWELADRTAFTVGRVTFTRHNLTELTVPFATVTFFNEDCTLIVRHQVFVDASAILPPAR
jgi:hypothetical protein